MTHLTVMDRCPLEMLDENEEAQSIRRAVKREQRSAEQAQQRVQARCIYEKLKQEAALWARVG